MKDEFSKILEAVSELEKQIRQKRPSDTAEEAARLCEIEKGIAGLKHRVFVLIELSEAKEEK